MVLLLKGSQRDLRTLHVESRVFDLTFETRVQPFPFLIVGVTLRLPHHTTLRRCIWSLFEVNTWKLFGLP